MWRADLDAAGEELVELLTRPERARGERILGARERERWLRGRGLLRDLLGSYTGADPRELRFRAGAHGKPALRGAPAGAPAFNLSHSGAVALIAFSAAGAVGVDVEAQARRGIRTETARIARRAFGEAQAARIAALPPGAREDELLRLWTRHEAQLKRRGSGIGAGLARIGPPGGWVADLDPGPRLYGALALARAPREVRCLSLD